jgi:hypothetical protein
VKPARIQLSRRKGWRKPEAAVVVAKPGRWGNRYVIGQLIDHVGATAVLVRDRTHAVALHREWLDGEMARVATMREDIRRDLGGRDLCCWCPLDEPCHADTLLKVANK